MNQLALPTTVADLIDEYEAKVASIDEAMAMLNQACTDMDNAATVAGTYVERNFDRPTLYRDILLKNLLKSGWKAIYTRVGVDAILSANDRKLWEKTLADPPPLTMETALATFKDYLTRPRFHILRGLAEVFCGLDQAYKSHSKVRIGVKGLPKRVILSWGSYAYGYGFDQFRDMVNALAALQNRPQFDWQERQAIDAAHDQGEDAVLDGRVISKTDRYGKTSEFQTVDRGLTIRKFGNGNAHVFFDKGALLDINRALAEFYGEVLPDVEPEDIKPSASTAVSKDLQFYWSPPAVVAAALEFAGISKPDLDRHRWRGEEPPQPLRVLEPSCGDGRILDELRARGCRPFGIEYHPGRAAECKAKGHAVLCANFLEQPAQAEFDAVVMNPPFYGRHYVKHVRHAMKFLRSGGTLVAILPATARYDQTDLHEFIRAHWKNQWSDLPVASFAEAGTNVPTTLFRWRKAA